MKKKIYLYSCQYYDKDGKIQECEKSFRIDENHVPNFFKVYNTFLRSINDIEEVVSVHLVSVTDDNPELVWVLAEPLVSGVKPQWIPAYKCSDGTIKSINGDLVCDLPDADNYIKPFTECPYEGYTISKI